MTSNDEMKVGQLVFWDDPEGISSDFAHIYSINGDVIGLEMVANGFTEAFASELTIVEEPAND